MWFEKYKSQKSQKPDRTLKVLPKPTLLGKDEIPTNTLNEPNPLNHPSTRKTAYYYLPDSETVTPLETVRNNPQNYDPTLQAQEPKFSFDRLCTRCEQTQVDEISELCEYCIEKGDKDTVLCPKCHLVQMDVSEKLCEVCKVERKRVTHNNNITPLLKQTNKNAVRTTLHKTTPERLCTHCEITQAEKNSNLCKYCTKTLCPRCRLVQMNINEEMCKVCEDKNQITQNYILPTSSTPPIKRLGAIPKIRTPNTETQNLTPTRTHSNNTLKNTHVGPIIKSVTNNCPSCKFIKINNKDGHCHLCELDLEKQRLNTSNTTTPLRKQPLLPTPPLIPIKQPLLPTPTTNTDLRARKAYPLTNTTLNNSSTPPSKLSPTTFG